jgi:membrane-associated protease RseP (regulator of RpoE activity)
VDPVRDDAGLLVPPEYVWLPRRKFRDRVWRHVLLLALTIVSTTMAGACHYASFESDFGAILQQGFDPVPFFANGLWYSVTILVILGCHEMGHYLACRYYDVDASLPFFLPAPLPLTGTLGAFIRIREPIPSKRMLFDIGIAGPIAGFLLAVPALFIGLSLSRIAAIPPGMNGVSLGEPLLFQWAAALIWGTPAEGYAINMHPVAFAAWFGLLATALNLFPIGQLDGGHISYAVLGRRSSHVTLLMVLMAIALTFWSRSWLVWTVLMVTMLMLFGRHHPSTADEHVPLDGTRVMLALFALFMFVVCFTPAPIEPLEIIGR